LTTKRTLTRWAGLLAASAFVFAACSSDGGASAAPSADGGDSGSMDALIAAAKEEGTLTTIALPDYW
jgi:putative spermidine/putrescine transport system substrate-binding protein